MNRWHCERSGAGLVYDDDAEFAQCLRFVAEAPEAAARSPPPAATTCSSTTPGRRSSTRVESLASTPGCPGADVRILMVSPYPPTRDGLANYAVQEVKRLRAEGHDVEVLSPGPVGRAPPPRPRRASRGGLALAKRVRGYDRVIVQFHPAMFFPEPSTSPERAAIYGALAVAWRAAPDVELRVHEFPHEGAAGEPARSAGRARDVAGRRSHPRAHRASSATLLAAAFGLSPRSHHGRRSRRELRAPHASSSAGRGARPARARAGRVRLPVDRVPAAAQGLRPRGARVRRPRRARLPARDRRLAARRGRPSTSSYLDDLRELVDATPGVTLHEEYVSDAEFDVWIVAADALVLPYRLIWSSSVCERASLYHRPVIASRVGGLDDQTPADAIMVDDDRELAEAMQRVAGLEPRRRAAGPWPGADRDAVMRGDPARGPAPHHSGVRPGTGTADAGDAAAHAAPAAAAARSPGPARSGPGSSTVKWVVRLLTAWELDPVVSQVNRLQQTVDGRSGGPRTAPAAEPRTSRADGPRTPRLSNLSAPPLGGVSEKSVSARAEFVSTLVRSIRTMPSIRRMPACDHQFRRETVAWPYAAAGSWPCCSPWPSPSRPSRSAVAAPRRRPAPRPTDPGGERRRSSTATELALAGFYPSGGPSVAFSSPAIGDVTGDGQPDVVTGGMDGCVRVFSLAGAVAGQPVPLGRPARGAGQPRARGLGPERRARHRRVRAPAATSSSGAATAPRSCT